jgi:hypothetical protein
MAVRMKYVRQNVIMTPAVTQMGIRIRNTMKNITIPIQAHREVIELRPTNSYII